MFDLSILVKYFAAYDITLTIDKARTLTVGMFLCVFVSVYLCICVCKSMTVNGRNPSTNPHLSSWITDIINRRYSSISPVFPIQRWEAGLFPSLSADLMTFTKLLCVYLCIYLYVYIDICSNCTEHSGCESVVMWVCCVFSSLATFVETWCCLFVFHYYCRSV